MVSTTEIPTNFFKFYYKCDDGTDNSDGIASFNFSDITDEIIDIFPINQQLIVTYYKNEDDARSKAMRPKAIEDNSKNAGPGAKIMRFADLAGGPDKMMKIEDGKVMDIRLFSDWDNMNEETDYDNTDAVSGDINFTTDNPAADAEFCLALNEEVASFKKLAGIIK